MSLIIGGEILEFSYQRFGTIKTTKFSSHFMVVLEFDFGIERKIEIRKRNNGKRKNDTKYTVINALTTQTPFIKKHDPIRFKDNEFE